jgi:hypothetical protein
MLEQSHLMDTATASGRPSPDLHLVGSRKASVPVKQGGVGNFMTERENPFKNTKQSVQLNKSPAPP